MKRLEIMSKRELRGELRRHRSTLRFIAGGVSGNLAQTYIDIAQKAIVAEEKKTK